MVTPGIVITPTQAQARPVVKYDAEPDAFYTLVKTDPDAPSRGNPIYGQWCVVERTLRGHASDARGLVTAGATGLLSTSPVRT